MFLQSNFTSYFNKCLTEKAKDYPPPPNNIYNYYIRDRVKYSEYEAEKKQKLTNACFFESDVRIQSTMLRIAVRITGVIFLLFLYSIICFVFQYRRNKQEIVLINRDGLLKKCPIGFSCITLFFGFFVPLSRADLKWFFVILIFDITLIGVISHIFFALKYNKLYILECLEKGYKPYDEKTIKILHQIGIYYKNTKE
jgi:hypothetical protein